MLAIFVSTLSTQAETLTEDTVWSGTVDVEGELEVADGVTLSIDPGTVVRLAPGATVVVRGRLMADGTEPEPIRFTRASDTEPWERIYFIRADDSRLRYVTIEYADSEGDHKDYYDDKDENCEPVSERDPRDYHEAVVVIASHVDIENCVFQNLPGGGDDEGDAIAVISDDPVHPGDASAIIRGCQFLSIGQGVHTRYAYVLVEECFFTDHHGDNDDVDLYGESDPPPLILNNVFLDPDHDDMINPTRCSARLIGNVIAGSDDHGIVLRDRCDPVLINNVIYDCSSAGIAVQNSCDALLVNNTIANCGRGVRFFDHTGRWGLPYCLTPGSGRATVINTIVWDCPTPMSLADTPYEEEPGSHVTIEYSSIDGTLEDFSVDSESTVTWGDGNRSDPPMFVDPDSGDFRLAEGSPLVDQGTADGAPEIDFDGKPRPCGEGVDIGAFEYGECDDPPPPGPRFVRGDANADGSEDVSDALTILFFLFGDGAEPVCRKSADADDSGELNLADAVYSLNSLFLLGPAPPLPNGACGADPTEDGLPCEAYPPCA